MNKNTEARREDETVTMEIGLVYHKINKQKHKKRKVIIVDKQMMIA